MYFTIRKNNKADPSAANLASTLALSLQSIEAISVAENSNICQAGLLITMNFPATMDVPETWMHASLMQTEVYNRFEAYANQEGKAISMTTLFYAAALEGHSSGHRAHGASKELIESDSGEWENTFHVNANVIAGGTISRSTLRGAAHIHVHYVYQCTCFGTLTDTTVRRILQGLCYPEMTKTLFNTAAYSERPVSNKKGGTEKQLPDVTTYSTAAANFTTYILKAANDERTQRAIWYFGGSNVRPY